MLAFMDLARELFGKNTKAYSMTINGVPMNVLYKREIENDNQS